MDKSSFAGEVTRTARLDRQMAAHIIGCPYCTDPAFQKFPLNSSTEDVLRTLQVPISLPCTNQYFANAVGAWHAPDEVECFKCLKKNCASSEYFGSHLDFNLTDPSIEHPS